MTFRNTVRSGSRHEEEAQWQNWRGWAEWHSDGGRAWDWDARSADPWQSWRENTKIETSKSEENNPWEDMLDQTSPSSASVPGGVGSTLACRMDGRNISQIEEFFAVEEGFIGICPGAPEKNCFLKFQSTTCAEKALARASASGFVIQYSHNEARKTRSYPGSNRSYPSSYGYPRDAAYEPEPHPDARPDSVLCESTSQDFLQLAHRASAPAAVPDPPPPKIENDPDMLRHFAEQKELYGNYLPCWNVVCLENPEWLTLKMSTEGYISPWCKVCSAFADQHLQTPKCRNKVQNCGLTPGVFLKKILDHPGVLPSLTEEQLRLPPTRIWPLEVKPSRLESTTSSLAANPVHMQSSVSPPTAVTEDVFLTDSTRHYRCANPVCSFLINPDHRSGGFCCKNCSDHFFKGKENKRIDHGRFCKCVPAPSAAPRAPPVAAQSLKATPTMPSLFDRRNGPENSPLPHPARERFGFPLLQPGHWRAIESVPVQAGLDVDTDELRLIQPGKVWQQAGEPILIQEGNAGDLLKLRLPLSRTAENEQCDKYGWVTLAEQSTQNKYVKVFFQVSCHVDLEGLLSADSSFDRLWMDVKAAADDVELKQELLRTEVRALACDSVPSGGKEWLSLADLVAYRDESRRFALQRVRDLCERPSVKLCRSEKWSGCGEREARIDLAHTWLFHFERADEVNFEELVSDLKASRDKMRKARVAFKKKNLELENAPDEDKSQDEINALKEQNACKQKELRVCMRNHRKKMCELISLADQYFPEHRREIIEVEKDFLHFNVQSDSKVWQVLDFERELSHYRDARVISDCNARHTVYEAEGFDGKPCVLKKIDWHSAEGSKAFVKEVTMLVKVRHPLIVSLQCAFMDAKSPQFGYLQFERLESNLEEWIDRTVASGPEDIMQTCSIVYALIQAVVWIHSQEVVHCDIKPPNFLWDGKKKIPRLADFETAREDSASSSGRSGTTTRIPFTWEYLAPELLADPTTCPRTKATDVFALSRTVKTTLDRMARNETSQGKELRVLAGDTCMMHSDACQRMTAVQAEERCCRLFHRSSVGYRGEMHGPGVVSVEIVRCRDVRYTQRTISNRFRDGRSFDTLISALCEDPSYALNCDSLKLQAVKIGRWIHSNDNRRLHCFHEAQRWIPEDLWIRIELHEFGETFQRLMGRYNTRTDGLSVRVTEGRSFYDRRPTR